MVRASVPKRIRSHDVAAVIARRLLMLEDSLDDVQYLTFDADPETEAAEDALAVASYELHQVAIQLDLGDAVDRILEASKDRKARICVTPH